MPTVREVWEKQLAEWIETQPLAEAVLDTMEDQLAEVTLENAKQLWLDFLETELARGLSNSLAALIEGGGQD
jgi:hypothetical protein